MFGPRAKYWGEKFLGEGHTHLLATDAHSNSRRVPRLSEAHAVAQRFLGTEEADRLVLERPQAILDDREPSLVTPPPELAPQRSWLHRLLRRGH